MEGTPSSEEQDLYKNINGVKNVRHAQFLLIIYVCIMYQIMIIKFNWQYDKFSE